MLALCLYCILPKLNFIVNVQLQVEPIAPHPKTKYWGVYHATHTIIRQEGVSALWKGHVPAQLLSISYGLCQVSKSTLTNHLMPHHIIPSFPFIIMILFGVLQVAVFEKLTEKAWFHLPSLQGDSYRPMVHFACAVVAGTIACVVSFPLDTIRTRLVAQGYPKVKLKLLFFYLVLFLYLNAQTHFWILVRFMKGCIMVCVTFYKQAESEDYTVG